MLMFDMAKNTLYIFLILCISDKISCSRSYWLINYQKLMESYFLLCGPEYMCDPWSIIPLTLKTSFEYRNLIQLCPECFCDDECLFRNDCCPDLYFSLPRQLCTNTSVLDYINEEFAKEIILPILPPSHHILVKHCPKDADLNLTQLCNGTKSLVQHLLTPVVTSTKFPVTYLNEYCAYCNGENNNTIDYWMLDIACLFFADFNFLSSYTEIISLAKEKACTFRYIPTRNNTTHECHHTNHNKGIVYDKCNITGTWTKFDPDIEMACLNDYENKYGIFKNIFCYMCNPPKPDHGFYIDTCNVTEHWFPLDIKLDFGCRFYSKSFYTAPFKNIFCFLCNRINFPHTKYLDSTVSISLRILKIGSYAYNFEFESLFGSFLHHIYTRRSCNFTTTYLKENTNSLRIHGSIINVTNLAYYQFARVPEDNFCKRNLLPLEYTLKISDMCSCSDKCIFSNMNCCWDHVITMPISCIDENGRNSLFDDTNITSYLIIDDCHHLFENPAINSRCNKLVENDIFSILPVTFDGISYKNSHCFVCRYMKPSDNEITVDNFVSNLDSYKFKPWNLTLFCSHLLDTEHNVEVYHILKLANTLGCEMKFNRDMHTKTECLKKSGIISKCNMTGSWVNFDPDIKWACEHTLLEQFPMVKNHKNYFCYLCNPSFKNSFQIDECNVTGLWKNYNPLVEKACELFPRIESMLHFKNVFCEYCNTNIYRHLYINMFTRNIQAVHAENNDKEKVYLNSYRNLFSISSIDEEDESNDINECKDKQVYDKNKKECRDIFCFPGKVFNNQTCTPLLKVTSNLRYSIAMSLKGHSLLTVYSHIYLMNNIVDYFKKYLILRLKTLEILFEDIILISNLPCNSDAKKEYEFLFKFTLFIKGFVPRRATEEILINFQSRHFVIQTKYLNLNLQAEPTLASFSASLYFQKLNQKNNCYLQSALQKDMSPEKSFQMVIATKLLLCSQIELHESEYKLVYSTMEVELIPWKKHLAYNNYVFSSKGGIRICVDDFLRLIFEIEDVTGDLGLGIFTLICTSLSLICLLFTFLVYCFCPKLRTVPGCNNMFLVASLFLAQLSFQVGYSSNYKTCIVIGVLKHFCWLSVFSWMNVCSIHMFKVFAKSSMFVESSGSKHLFLYYVLYASGISTTIVGTNIFVNGILNNWQTVGYGMPMCFISNKAALCASFIAPITIILITNCVLFSCTAWKISRIPLIERSTNAKRQNDIYIRLFALTGVSWILVLLDMFLPLTALSYISTAINGSQGVFIFLSFVVNKRTLAMFKEKLRLCCNCTAHSQHHSPRKTSSTCLT